MRLINRKNFFTIYCKVFTILSLVGAILDIRGRKSVNYSQLNLILIAVLSLVALAILSQSYRLEGLSSLKMLIILYLTALLCVYAIMWISTLFGIQIHPDGYRDIFISFSVPYLPSATFYLYMVKKETRQQNEDIQLIRRIQKEKEERKEIQE